MSKREFNRVKDVLLSKKGYYSNNSLKKGYKWLSRHLNVDESIVREAVESIRSGSKTTLETKPEPAVIIKPNTYNIDKPGTYWITGCTHAPWHNKGMYDSTIEFIRKEVDIDGIILAGDFVDLNSLSYHDRGNVALPGVTLDWEYREANKLLDYIDSLESKRDFKKIYIYGNHCFEEGTEILTEDGFIDFRELKEGVKVASFDKDFNIKFEVPSRIVKTKYNGILYDIESNYSRQSVTDMHNIVLNDFSKKKAKDLSIEDVLNIPVKGKFEQEGYDIDDNALRLSVSKKEFPDWFRKLNRRQAIIVLDEISKTDGSLHDGGIVWTTTSLKDSRIIQEMCVLNNITSNFTSSENKGGFKNSKTQYRHRMNLDSSHVIIPSITEKEYDGNVYCVTTSNGTVITRLEGKTAFSGNCDRYHRLLNSTNESKYGAALKSPVEGLKLSSRGYTVLEDWKSSHVNIGRHLEVNHGEFFNVHTAKKTIDTYRKSVLYFHSHRFQVYMEGRVGGWNMGTGANIDAPVFNYASRAMKNSWVNNSALVTLDNDGYYHVQPMIYMNNKLMINGREY